MRLRKSNEVIKEHAEILSVLLREEEKKAKDLLD
jgi:hypothetical protein